MSTHGVFNLYSHCYVSSAQYVHARVLVFYMSAQYEVLADTHNIAIHLLLYACTHTL
jgi:hypothetical protein